MWVIKSINSSVLPAALISLEGDVGSSECLEKALKSSATALPAHGALLLRAIEVLLAAPKVENKEESELWEILRSSLCLPQLWVRFLHSPLLSEDDWDVRVAEALLGLAGRDWDWDTLLGYECEGMERADRGRSLAVPVPPPPSLVIHLPEEGYPIHGRGEVKMTVVLQ